MGAEGVEWKELKYVILRIPGFGPIMDIGYGCQHLLPELKCMEPPPLTNTPNFHSAMEAAGFRRLIVVTEVPISSASLCEFGSFTQSSRFNLDRPCHGQRSAVADWLAVQGLHRELFLDSEAKTFSAAAIKLQQVWHLLAERKILVANQEKLLIFAKSSDCRARE